MGGFVSRGVGEWIGRGGRGVGGGGGALVSKWSLGHPREGSAIAGPARKAYRPIEGLTRG